MTTTAKSLSLATEKQISTEIEEQIRRRAYQLYERRGNTGGCELEDWLQAETEVLESNREPLAA